MDDVNDAILAAHVAEVAEIDLTSSYQLWEEFDAVSGCPMVGDSVLVRHAGAELNARVAYVFPSRTAFSGITYLGHMIFSVEQIILNRNYGPA